VPAAPGGQAGCTVRPAAVSSFAALAHFIFVPYWHLCACVLGSKSVGLYLCFTCSWGAVSGCGAACATTQQAWITGTVDRQPAEQDGPQSTAARQARLARQSSREVAVVP